MTRQRTVADASEMVSIEGMLESIVFSTKDNSFTVARFRHDEQVTTIVGSILSTNEGERLRLTGEWKKHPKYGKQFQVNHFEVILPTQKEAIEKYLSSGIIHGIGESLAKRIVARFGEETFEILDKDCQRIREVNGIGKKKAEKIESSWREKRGVHDAMMFLSSYDIGGMRAAKIYKKYGGNLVSILKEHPYRLAIDIDGIGFATADNIARKIGIPLDDPERIQAALLHLLNEAGNQGHCYLPREELCEQAARLIGQDEGLIFAGLEAAIKAGHIIANEDAIYLSRIHFCEKQAATYLTEILAGKSTPIRDLDKAIARAEREMGIQFQGGQQQALERTLTAKVSIITGGPGVGKTTILQALVAILKRSGQKIALAAPTGRASKRLSEAAGESASTIHRLLRYNPHEKGFEHGYDNKLKVDWLIIDESSMLDISLAYHLLAAVPREAVITFVGDCDQLPSVGPGNFLADLIESGAVAVSRLTQIFRQSTDSSIVHAAHQINAGICPKIVNDANSDIFFIQEENCERGADTIVDLVARRLPEKYGLDPTNDIQTLTPMYRADVGANNLNELLSRALNARRTSSASIRKFCQGDKVMQVSNNYEKDVYNGDIGIIGTMDRVEQMAAIRFDNREVVYDFSEFDQLTLAYAISIHKSQGSEYPAVVIPLFTQHFIMLERNLLYTAITRGKRLVVLVGSWQALSLAIRNVRARNRYTRLASLLS